MHTRQLQLLAKQRSRMAEILKHLLPSDMVEMVLSIHFKTGNEALPITLCRCPPPPMRTTRLFYSTCTPSGW